MSLIWKVKNCLNLESRTDADYVTQDALVWLTMSVGLGEITKKNVCEFYFRTRVYEGLFGARRCYGGKYKYFSFPEIVRFIGLCTNASDMTRKQFIDRMWRMSEHDDGPRSEQVDEILAEVAARLPATPPTEANQES